MAVPTGNAAVPVTLANYCGARHIKEQHYVAEPVGNNPKEYEKRKKKKKRKEKLEEFKCH